MRNVPEGKDPVPVREMLTGEWFTEDLTETKLLSFIKIDAPDFGDYCIGNVDICDELDFTSEHEYVEPYDGVTTASGLFQRIQRRLKTGDPELGSRVPFVPSYTLDDLDSQALGLGVDLGGAMIDGVVRFVDHLPHRKKWEDHPKHPLSPSWLPFDAQVQSEEEDRVDPIINTRGTGARQGPSSGFTATNSNVQRQLSGGNIYNTVYPASFSQNSASGTTNIVNRVNSGLRTNPNECFILEGYSQGAAATTDALPRLTGNAFNAVKGVFLIGNPDHKSGLACNVDNNGGTTTHNVNGLSGRFSAGIPGNWISKTLDVCIRGDGVCDTTNGSGINGPHLQYPRDTPTQNLGTDFILRQLRAGRASKARSTVLVADQVA